jgi:hypothetical protein
MLLVTRFNGDEFSSDVGDGRFGSKTEVTALKSDFRCYPNNGHRATTAACPFRAKPGSPFGSTQRELLLIEPPLYP